MLNFWNVMAACLLAIVIYDGLRFLISWLFKCCGVIIMIVDNSDDDDDNDDDDDID